MCPSVVGTILTAMAATAASTTSPTTTSRQDSLHLVRPPVALLSAPGYGTEIGMKTYKKHSGRWAVGGGQCTRGFTLIELLIVIAIISAVTIATVPMLLPALDIR